MTLTIREFQEFIRDKYYETDAARGIAPTFMWFMEEIGELAAFLLCDRAASITGANMFADGGMTSQLVSREPFVSKAIDGR